MPKIREIAKVCKSKNAGPFEVTIDVVFDDRKLFEHVKASNVLNATLVSRLYKTPVADILFTVYDAGMAFKATIPRPVASGDLGDTDVYGSQQHAPLLEVEIP